VYKKNVVVATLTTGIY